MDKKSSNSVKQVGPIHMVFSGKRHIGNVIAPTIGGSREGAQHFTAISKFWGIKKAHDTKMQALQWLNQQHGEPMKMESVSKYTTHIHEYSHPSGMNGHIVQRSTNGKHEFHSSVDVRHKVTSPFKIVQHSSMEKAHKRMTGLGYKPTGETSVTNEEKKKVNSAYAFTTNLALTPKGMVKEDDWKEDIILAIQESVDNYRDQISKMQPIELNKHYHELYHAHMKTGMAPRYFKSPMHLAQIEEKERNLPVGTISKHVLEASNWTSGNAADSSLDTVGLTAHSLSDKKRKIKIRKLVRADPDNAAATLDTINGNIKVSEAYMIVMDKKKTQLAAAKAANDNKPVVKEELFDKDKNQKDPTAGPQPKKDEMTGDETLVIKKTATGKPGDLITFNPKMKVKKSGSDGDKSPEHKKKPGDK